MVQSEGLWTILKWLYALCSSGPRLIEPGRSRITDMAWVLRGAICLNESVRGTWNSHFFASGFPNNFRSSPLVFCSCAFCLAFKLFPPRLIWKLSMDIADWNGVPFRRLLRTAERLSEAAICRGFDLVKTPCSKSSASLRFMTSADHLRGFFGRVFGVF